MDVDVSGYQAKLVRLTVPADVDGVRYLFFTVVQIGTPADARSELERMVNSLEIEPAS